MLQQLVCPWYAIGFRVYPWYAIGFRVYPWYAIRIICTQEARHTIAQASFALLCIQAYHNYVLKKIHGAKG